MTTAPLPVSALPPSAHSSPRQHALSSKIPRRCPSAQLAAGPFPRAASSPVTGPGSPTRGALVRGGGGAGHARKSSLTSRAHFSELPSTVVPGAGAFGGELVDRSGSRAAAVTEEAQPLLQDRRRRASSTAETREVPFSGRRTPSLSICIPSAPSPSHQQSSASSARRPSQPVASTSRPSPSSAHPSSSPAHPFAPQSRRSSVRTPRSSIHGQTPVVRPPMMERTWSNSTTTTTYTSFDLQHPRTPKEERDEAELMRRRAGPRGWLRGWLGLVGLSGGEGSEADEERQVGERDPLLPPGQGSGTDNGVDWPVLVQSHESEPSQDVAAAERGGGGSSGRWNYVMGEVWCYAKHILPPLIVFVALVLTIALLAYRQAIRRVVHMPEV